MSFSLMTLTTMGIIVGSDKKKLARLQKLLKEHEEYRNKALRARQKIKDLTGL